MDGTMRSARLYTAVNRTVEFTKLRLGAVYRCAERLVPLGRSIASAVFTIIHTNNRGLLGAVFDD